VWGTTIRIHSRLFLTTSLPSSLGSENKLRGADVLGIRGELLLKQALAGGGSEITAAAPPQMAMTRTKS